MRTTVLCLVVLAGGCQEYELTGPAEGVPGGEGPELRVEPTAIDFGEVALDASASEVVTITNVGAGPLELDPLELVDAGVYSVAALQDLSLEAGESTDFAVTFEPVEPGLVEGQATVSSNAELEPEVDVALSGVGGSRLAHDVELMITADDAWSGWIDGQPITAPNQGDWFHKDELAWELESGDHVLSVHAQDQASVISGLIAVLAVDGVDTILTGDGSWQMSDTAPATGWEQPGFDASAWPSAVVCQAQDSWGTYWPADFQAAGAEWVWWTGDCSNLQEAWFRLEFTL